MGADEFRSEWRERPLTVRALLVLYAASFAISPFGATLPAASVAVAVGVLFLWGFWVGKRGVFILALVAEGMSLFFRLTTGPRQWWSIAGSAAAVLLLLAPATQGWVKRQTWERTEAARRASAAPST
ncbi:MAG TPA: hypothetical protein VG318_10380 [Actinomycetota bacterium]|nr:hypothetical protein [Actinomycetota bacterium]